MAKGRKATVVQKKLSMLIYGEQFTGKSSFASKLAYMHNEDGSPMKILYIDCEAGSIDNYLADMEANGVDLNNIYIIYTSSLAEVLEYIDKVKNNEDMFELDDDGNETDIVVTDAQGNPFRADAIVIDGATILHMSVQQGLLEFSRKRARVRANKNELTGEEKLVAVEGSSLEQKDWGAISYKGQNLILSLQAAGVHYIVTARETDEKETVKDSEGKYVGVPTGKKIPAGFKNMQYNVDTYIRLYRDEFDNVVANVEKDRAGVHPKEIVEDPQLTDWQVVIDKSKDKPKFVLKNDLDDAAQTEQKLYAKEVMGNDIDENAASPSASVKEVINEINAIMKGLSQDARNEKKNALTAASLPASPALIGKLTDISTLTKILNIVKA